MKLVSRVVILIAVLAGIAFAGTVAYAWSQGVRFYAVDSGSMVPAVHNGDMVVDAPVTADTSYQVGDIITFRPTPSFVVTHRIAAIGPQGITTKGDANATEDVSSIQPSQVIGRVSAVVPFGGYVAILLQQPIGWVALALVLTIIFLVWELAHPGKSPASGTDSVPDSSAS